MQDADFTATFGPYQIRKLLASGRIASVFDAVAGEDEAAGQVVALKVFAGRVRRDVELSPARARTLGVPGVRVQHPALVQLYEVGRVGENLFLSMEQVKGPNLEQLLTAAREGGHPLEPHVIMTLAVQVAEGLGALHLAEVDGSPMEAVHGDVRPSNILLGTDGQAKIAGWGVTNLVQAYTDLEDAERPLEPPLYVSPEQSRGEDLTPASDVFSWATLVLELITGKALFDTPTIKGSLRKLRSVQLKGPMGQAQKAFPDLLPVLERALAKDPAGRFHDGQELYEVLKPLAPPASGREILAQLIAEVSGDIPDDIDEDDELMDRVSYVSEEHSDPSISSFVLPPSDPIAGVAAPPPEELGPDGAEEESSDGPMSTDDLTATDEIGETEELLIAAAANSMVSDGEHAAVATGEIAPDDDEDGADLDTAEDDSVDSREEPDTADGEDDAAPPAGPDATETLPSDGVKADAALDPNLEASAFNLPSMDDDALETTVPPAPGEREVREAKGEAAAAGRKTERVFQGAPAAGRATAKRKAEKVTVWTGTSGRPETVASGEGEKKPGAKWPWILISIAAVVLLALFVVSELTPSRGSRGGGDGGGGAAVADGGTTGQAETGEGGLETGQGEEATPAEGVADGGHGRLEPTTEAPLLDPSILGPDPVRTVDDETRTAAEDGVAEAAEQSQEMTIQHSPVSRGIRGRGISVSVTVDPPGSYQAVIWYRAAGGPWNQTGARGGGNGSVSGTIPHGAWLGDDADVVEYYVEVVGVGGTRNAGSAVSPHSVKIY